MKQLNGISPCLILIKGGGCWSNSCLDLHLKLIGFSDINTKRDYFSPDFLDSDIGFRICLY